MLKPLLPLALASLLSGCELMMFGSTLAGCAMRPEPSLLPEHLPLAQAGVAYLASIEVIDTSSPVSRFVVDPQHPLPEGLTLEHAELTNRASLQGVPRQAGSYEIVISARTYGTQCTGATAERRYHLDVAP